MHWRTIICIRFSVIFMIDSQQTSQAFLILLLWYKVCNGLMQMGWSGRIPNNNTIVCTEIVNRYPKNETMLTWIFFACPFLGLRSQMDAPLNIENWINDACLQYNVSQCCVDYLQNLWPMGLNPLLSYNNVKKKKSESHDKLIDQSQQVSTFCLIKWINEWCMNHWLRLPEKQSHHLSSTP